jgi:hypothetical protein
MTVENPTGDAGASISERLERFLDPESSEQTTEANEATEVETPETEVENTADDALTESEEPQVSISDVAQYLGVGAGSGGTRQNSRRTGAAVRGIRTAGSAKTHHFGKRRLSGTGRGFQQRQLARTRQNRPR